MPGKKVAEVLARFHYGLLICIAFLFPFYQNFIVYFILPLPVIWLLSGNFWKIFREPRFRNYTLIFISLFLVYVAGLFYSDNLEFGKQDVVSKLTLLLFPLIFASTPELTKREFYKVLYAFILGNLVALLVCLGNSFLLWLETKNTTVFFYTDLSFMIHAGYFSMYLNLAIAGLVYLLFRKNYSKTMKFLLGLLISFFLLAIFLLEAKAGIITVICNSFALVIYLILRRNFIKQGIGILVGLLVVSLGAVSMVDSLNLRLRNAAEAMFTDTDDIDKSTVQSSAVRRLVWEAAIELGKEKVWLGVGTGDVKDKLVEKYDQLGLTGARDKRFNTHNQFLQTGVTLGLLGLSVLLINLIAGFNVAIRRKKNLYLVFLFIIVCNMMVESILEKQTGVVFFAFFNSFLLYSYNKTDYDDPILSSKV